MTKKEIYKLMDEKAESAAKSSIKEGNTPTKHEIYYKYGYALSDASNKIVDLIDLLENVKSQLKDRAEFAAIVEGINVNLNRIGYVD